VCPPVAAANPVVGGDHPDPSILRTAGGWYATSTSDDWLPAFPVLRSSDLVHWREAGAVLALRPGWARNDFWAPELVRRNDRFLAYYAALGKNGRRCVAGASSGRVAGPYQDHGPIVCSRTGEIDPLPVTDEQGGAWLLWKHDGNSRGRPTPILAAPLAPGGMSLATPPRELFRAGATTSRRPRSCATVASSTSSTRPGTAAAATAHTPRASRGRRRSSAPGRSAAGRSCAAAGRSGVPVTWA
jgi:hypothetical protein